MDKVIITVMLIIGGIAASLAVFNGIYPAITQSSGAISAAANKISNQIESRISIIQVGVDGLVLNAWVKNVGTVSILDVDNSDVFMSPQDSYQHIPFGKLGDPLPYWEYHMEGSGDLWGQTGTIKISINLAAPLTTGVYYFKMVIPNGISDEATFSVS